VRTKVVSMDFFLTGESLLVENMNFQFLTGGCCLIFCFNPGWAKVPLTSFQLIVMQMGHTEKYCPTPWI
jgi:hypothetical protein